MSNHGERCRKIRAENKLSQADLGRLLGVDTRTIYCWERGQKQPTGPGQIVLMIASTPDGLATVKSAALKLMAENVDK